MYSVSHLSSPLIFIILLYSTLQCTYGQVLTPPYFNLALGRRIVASATCGEDVPEPEIFCKLIGNNAEEDNRVIRGQVCDECDPKDKDKKHPAEFAVDGRETWWQSPPLSRGMKYNEVNLTIDLGQEFHVAYVIVKMGISPRPAVWVLEKSNDNGQTYSPWQYFADSVGECMKYFKNFSLSITSDDSVICDVQYSKITPLEGGDIVVQLVQNRPSTKDFFNSPVLQEWTRATNIRFRFLRVKNLLGHLMSVANQDPATTRRYFYAIKDISIGGRCRCNGHAETCTSVARNDPYKLVCDCKDNTCGDNCDTCCPGFEQKRWSQSKTNKKFVCERCNCFGHSDQCKYNETIDQLKLSLDIHGHYDGGGVCQNCQHFTTGVNCDKCIDRYYRPYGKLLNETDVCQPCRCDFTYSTGNCEDGTGKCECKPEYTKPNCDSCSFGYYGYPLCRACECNLNGTNTSQCNPQNGKCYCKSNYGGDLCRNCTEGYYNYPECKTCDCNSVGSVSNVCNVESGECKCKSSFGGRTCDECSDGYYKFPNCLYCNCDVKGTLPGICDKSNGQCLCKPGYGGSRCDQCVANFTGFPDCRPCNCSTEGSVSTVCDVTGRCPCLTSYTGKLCDQCSPGYYQYPQCYPCKCDSIGSIGVSCTNDGQCKCKNNFDGQKCTECREGYYNHPICEECNFDPAGVLSTFAGCGKLKPGELVKCKDNVQGKICGECKELYWNLQTNNPDGCEECSCNRSGTIGRIGSCDTKSGQCICKPSTVSRKCDQCLDGWYNLTDSNLFGCSDCDCDIGGSINNICNKVTGQCACLPRIGGKKCKEPIGLHYFPTLHQYQYEVEDGRTTKYTPVRYGFDEGVFPAYSWKGYAVFSHLQNETVHPVVIDKSSVYRMVIRYLHFHNQSITGSVSVVPEYTNNIDDEQKFQVVFKPTDKPAFVTVAGISGSNPSPFVMNPGPWNIKIKNEQSLFLDYFVLIPSEYYEGSALVSNVTTPCTLDKSELCRLYLYPNISSFDQIKGLGAYINNDDSRSPVQEYYDELEKPLGIAKMPKLSSTQPELYFNLRISRPGPYALVINYATTKNQNQTTIQIQATTQNSGNKGVVTIYRCRYRTLCRQAVSDREGRVAIWNFDSNNVNLILKGTGDGIAIDSVAAIPYEMWSINYVQPKPSCVINDAKCVPSTYWLPPDSERFDFKTENENRISKTQPSSVLDNATELVYLDPNDPMIDIQGKVSKPGPYMFVVHYFQPDHPDFESDIVIHNGQYYEAKLRTRHCPSVSGCRAIVQQSTGNSAFQLTENFMFTVKVPPHKGVWVQYVLLIPSSSFQNTEKMITELPFDQTTMFLSKCGNNHFYVNTSENGFCKEATFSLTAQYNHEALPCRCDFDGSLSLYCEPFGGQCPCRENVIGRRCDYCKTLHFGFPNCKPCNCSATALCDSNTGECICPQNVVGEKCNKCQPYTYGFDPLIGCEECNCNYYGVENNDLQCDLLTGVCKCKRNVEGRTCDRCVAGNHLFPYCYPCQCDLRGTTEEICNQTNAACLCKSNVQGLACDVCKDGTFNLQPDDPAGCTKCFCFGKTSRCISATLFSSAITSYENWQLASVNVTKSVEIIKLPTPIEEINGGISVNMAYVLSGITYFVAPSLFLGNKLTAYGGFLNYTIHYSASTAGEPVSSPDLILYGGNQYLYYTSFEQPSANSYLPVSVKMVESNFLGVNFDKVTREDFMQVLQNLTAIYIKASYDTKGEYTKLLSLSFEVAISEYIPNTGIVLAIEQCSCPPNYVGLSCEECADGYYRVSAGLFGGNCIPCQCNGHSNNCDKTTGICYDCKHHTKGEHCEKCEVGYHGNATLGTQNDCFICACPLPFESNNFATDCNFDENGESVLTCDCIPGYTGLQCGQCAPGYYGRPDIQGEKCVPCECNGNINPSEVNSCDPVTGKCLKCLNNTYGDSCERCAPYYFGDAIVAKNCQPCYCDQCGTKECNHRTGECTCHENIVGDKCDRCADNHFGFTACQGCVPCNCANASLSQQCDDFTGQCKCQDGVGGTACDRCKPGYWQYSQNGCVSCGCNLEYSIGLGCNIATGLCECLPGVVGDKCDSCPHRWVLIKDRGCDTCDKCTHGLLDVTDQLHADFQPLYSKFQTTAAGHFTVQRLRYINNTVDALAPNISNLLTIQFDLTPYDEKIAALDKEKETSLRKIQSIANDLKSSSVNIQSAKQDAFEVEDLIYKVSDKSFMTIHDVNKLAHNLETSSVSQIDHAIQESKNLLDYIQDFETDSDTVQSSNEAETNARKISSKVTDFSAPVNATVQKLEIVRKNAETLFTKLDELANLTEKAQKYILEASNISQSNNKSKLIDRIHSLNDGVKESNTLLMDTKKVLQNISIILGEVIPVYGELAWNATKLKSAKESATQKIQSFVDDLNSLKVLVSEAKTHAADLEHQAEMLNAIIKNQISSDHAVRAANSYHDIIKALNDAKNAADEAKKAADNFEQFKGLGDKVQTSTVNSANLVDSARKALEDVQRNLISELASTVQSLDAAIKLNNRTADSAENLRRMIQQQKETPRSQIGNFNVEDISANAISTLDKVKAISENSSSTLSKAKELYAKRDSTKKNTQQTTNHLAQIEAQEPEITTRVNKLKSKPAELEKKTKNIEDMLNDLKQKLTVTRDLAAKIKVGVKLYQSASMELPIPSNLLDQGSSTDLSLYFNTTDLNGLLMYLGNPVGSRQTREPPKIRKPKTDDFLALELENGYLLLTVDLGEKKPASIALPTKFVADGKWYKVEIKRTGKLLNLTVFEEEKSGKITGYSSSGNCPGSSSVLNLDKDHSKFFVGGLPSSFEAPDVIKKATFNGEVEELTVDGVLIGLWNFVAISSNTRNVPVSKVDGAVQRDKLISKTIAKGCRFNSDGYVVLKSDGISFSEKARVSISFKTTSLNGLLFLVHKGSTFMAIELRQGFVYFQYNVGNGLKSLHTTTQYNDDMWHVVLAVRSGNQGQLTVDETSFRNEIDNRKGELQMSEFIYIGGYPGDHKITDVTKEHFEGCIDSVEFNDGSMDLNTNLNNHGIIPGCPEKFARFAIFEESARKYVRWPDKNIVKEWSKEFPLELTLQFKTQAKNGLIVFGFDNTNSFGLLLKDGSISFRSGKREVNTGPNVKYNDDRWHSLMAIHGKDTLHLIIDDFDVFKSPEAPEKIQLEHVTLYFGTVPSDVHAAAAIEPQFIGSVGDATLNGVAINFEKSFDRDKEPPPSPIEKSPVVSTPVTIAPTTTLPPSVVMAPGCLPLYPAVDTDISKESGYRFGTAKNGTMIFEFDPSKLNGKVELSIDLRTVSTNGIIFYVTNPTPRDFIALYVKDSKLFLSFKCAANSISIISEQQINEGEWHTVKFKINENQASLQIDDRETKTSSVGCKAFSVAAPYYLGGVDSPTLKAVSAHLEGFNKSFIGCLKNFVVNEVHYDNPATSVGVIPCSYKVESGVFFPVNGGYLKANDSFKVGKELLLELEIKPRNLDGLLLAVHGRKSYYVLQMIDGSIKLTVDNGNGPFYASYKPTNGSLCDGEWHTISALKRKSLVALTIDGDASPFSNDPAGTVLTNTNNPLYIGGYPPNLAQSKGIETNVQYVGCMRNFKLNEVEHNLSSYTPYGNAMLNVCPTI